MPHLGARTRSPAPRTHARGTACVAMATTSDGDTRRTRHPPPPPPPTQQLLSGPRLPRQSAPSEPVESRATLRWRTKPRKPNQTAASVFQGHEKESGMSRSCRWLQTNKIKLEEGQHLLFPALSSHPAEGSKRTPVKKFKATNLDQIGHLVSKFAGLPFLVWPPRPHPLPQRLVSANHFWKNKTKLVPRVRHSQFKTVVWLVFGRLCRKRVFLPKTKKRAWWKDLNSGGAGRAEAIKHQDSKWQSADGTKCKPISETTRHRECSEGADRWN